MHCPTCSEAFLLLRQGDGSVRLEPPPRRAPGGGPAPVESATTASAASQARAPAEGGDAPGGVPAPGAFEEPGQVAAELLDSLVSRLGSPFQEAQARGRLLAHFGPDMMRAFEEYRRRLGDRGTPGAFRSAVRERWGVDLSPASHPKAE